MYDAALNFSLCCLGVYPLQIHSLIKGKCDVLVLATQNQREAKKIFFVKNV